MTSTLPPIAISLIEDFASVKLTTKKYKSMRNAHKCRITKVKYKCDMCDALKNNRQIELYHDNVLNICKKNCCTDNNVDKFVKLRDEVYYTNKYGYFPYGEKSELTENWYYAMKELLSKHCSCGKCYHCEYRKCKCNNCSSCLSVYLDIHRV